MSTYFSKKYSSKILFLSLLFFFFAPLDVFAGCAEDYTVVENGISTIDAEACDSDTACSLITSEASGVQRCQDASLTQNTGLTGSEEVVRDITYYAFANPMAYLVVFAGNLANIFLFL